jgi:hypothetical protein
MGGDDERGTTGGMIGRGNWITCGKPAPVQFCPQHILYHLTLAQTWANMVGSQ